MINTNIGRLRIIGFLEGISTLILFGIAMPMKYALNSPELIRPVGMAHGILFIAYILWLAIVWIQYKLSLKEFILSFLASFIPFGTFVADAKIFKRY